MFSATAVASALEQKWQSEHRFVSRPHECSARTCKIIPLDAWVFNDHGEIGISWTRPKRKAQRVRNMYMCVRTGQGHWCTENCGAKRIVSEDDGQVCAISGIRYDNVEADVWRPTQRITTTGADQKDPYKMGDVDSSLRLSVRKQQYGAIIRKQIHLLLFSQKRMYHEFRKYVQARNDAQQLVIRYVRSCERRKKMVVLPRLICLYMYKMHMRPILTHIERDTKKQEKLVNIYIERILALWRVIMEYTPLGRNQPGIFIFHAFVVAALYQMRSGLWCQGQCIIQRDYYLDRCLPETNTLDIYNLSKPQFTTAKKNILKAVREAGEARIDVRLLAIS